MRTRAEQDGPEHRALKRVLSVYNDNQSELARVLNERLVEAGRADEAIKQNTISWWLHKSFRVPAELARDLEALTGVKAEELRPDVFRPATA